MAGHAEHIDNKTLWGGNGSPFRISYGKQMMWFFLVSDALTFGGLLTGYGFARHTHDAWPIGEQVFRSLPFLTGDYPLIYVALMTFILIVSSVTMVLAVEAGHRMDKKGVIKWLFLTVIGGFFFVGSQAWEWGHFIHGSHDGAVQISETQTARIVHHGEEYSLQSYQTGKVIAEGNEALSIIKTAQAEDRILQGANMTENEYGHTHYANFFFFITGFHGFHVFSGVVINLIILLQVVRGAYDKRGHFEMVEKVGLYWHFVDLVWVFVFTFFYLV
jgi:cytochrome c oxidase subunit III